MKIFMGERADEYIAPYTSLITASMIGKSRLMKQLANYMPVIYLCFRTQNSTGYPPRSPIVPEWFGTPVKVAGKFYLLPTYKYTTFLLVLLEKLTALFETHVPRDQRKHKNFQWLWEYFAEPREEDVLKAFWNDVTASVNERLAISKLLDSSAVEQYYRSHIFHNERDKAYEALRKTIRKVYNLPEGEQITILLLCDEARFLCTASAVACTEDWDPKEPNKMWSDGFSCFRALRRALRFVARPAASALLEGETMGLFGLFTDTTPHLTNFQPRVDNDSSSRYMNIPAMDFKSNQFPPIHIFTSIDAWARLDNSVAASVERVAKPSRLARFGRAGWAAGLKKEPGYRDVEFAAGKLLCSMSASSWKTIWKPDSTLPPVEHRLTKLLAVLAPRLALAPGPLTEEASEMVASHLAVLFDTQPTRKFLRIVYPSEPILAEASAFLTGYYGWGPPIRALSKWLQLNILASGYRGELLSKIICLMTADRVQQRITRSANKSNSKSSTYSSPTKVEGQADTRPKTNRTRPVYSEGEWDYSRPLTVHDFLNHLIDFTSIYNVPKNCKATTFSEYLMRYSTIDEDKLKRFLEGHVFFTHFIQQQQTPRIDTLVKAFNRGAAIMCAPGTPRFDHIIPVLLKDADTKGFGDLYNAWSEEQLDAARNNMSYILIQSKHYSSSMRWITETPDVEPIDKDWNTTGGARTIRGLAVRIPNLLDSLPSNNVFLSLIQDFGMREIDERPIEVEPICRSSKYHRKPRRDRQIQVVMRGLDDRTYRCLKKDEFNEPGDYNETLEYLTQIRDAKITYFDLKPTISELPRLDSDTISAKKDSIPLILPMTEVNDGLDPRWRSLREAKSRHEAESMGSEEESVFDSES